MTTIRVVAHCLLNPETRLAGLSPVVFRPEAPLIQLACPEAGILGLDRWAVTKNQIDIPTYRRYCREIFSHPRTAEARSGVEGDAAKIVTETGELHGRVRVVDHIVEGIVFTASHFSPLAPFEGNRGDSINTAVPNHWDRISAQYNGFGCRLEKI